MSRDRKGENPWSDMSPREVSRNTARHGGYDGWFATSRAWGRNIMFASATIGIVAYLAKQNADGRIFPHPDDCDNEFDASNPSTFLGGYCDSVINGRSEAVYTPQASNHIDPEEMVIAVASIGFIIGLVLFSLGNRSHQPTRVVAA